MAYILIAFIEYLLLVIEYLLCAKKIIGDFHILSLISVESSRV